MRDGLFGQVPIVRTSRVDGRKIIEGEWRDSEAHERPVHVVTLKDGGLMLAGWTVTADHYTHSLYLWCPLDACTDPCVWIDDNTDVMALTTLATTHEHDAHTVTTKPGMTDGSDALSDTVHMNRPHRGVRVATWPNSRWAKLF